MYEKAAAAMKQKRRSHVQLKQHNKRQKNPDQQTEKKEGKNVTNTMQDRDMSGI